MQRLITVLCLSVLMTGCFLTPEPIVIEKPIYIEKPLIHPGLPEPFVFEYQAPEVVTKETIQNKPDNVVYQAFEWNDGQDLRIQLEKWLTYTRQLQGLLCLYRKELEEEFCQKFSQEQK